jgi:DNA modification methylase
MTDVWSFGRVVGEERGGHATPKPVEMVARAIKSSSQEGDAIAVPFGGTGPEIIAAEQLNRTAYAMELEPKWCDVIVKRWENLTGETAVLADA